MHILGNQIKTLNLQISYDTKLNNATYDALKAFQLNTINSDTSDLSNSKLRDIEASVNTFFNSIASNFNMAGYNQDVLKDYVPALVYTMYDGYYIYSPYTNTLDSTNSNTVVVNNETGETTEKSDADILSADNEDATYKQGDTISGLKPYIYYSCRYKYGSSDFVITYSLDNYITIQGKINGNAVYDYGYLLDNVEVNGDTVTYRGIEISDETLTEWICDPDSGDIKEYEYIKINGTKYYKDGDKWFSVINSTKYYQDNIYSIPSSAKQYYKDALAFTNRIKNDYKLTDLTGEKAVDENGAQIDTSKLGTYKIFDFGSSSGTSIEDPNSNFNQQRLAVIRYSIEKNLSIAIANYNNYSGAGANFLMPELKEDEWDNIVNNVSIISFLQGLSIGGKIYNGYSIITNNKNEEVVSEDSIYILTADGQYHRANDKDLTGTTSNTGSNIVKGVLNIDFEVKSTSTNGTTKYFIPQQNSTNPYTGCYTSIVTQTNVNTTDNMYKYIAKQGGKLAEAYFTALGRERYSMYRSNNVITDYSPPTADAAMITNSAQDIVYDSTTDSPKILANSINNGGTVTAKGKTSMTINAVFTCTRENAEEQMIVSTTEQSGWSIRISGNNNINFEIYNTTTGKYTQCSAGKVEVGKKYFMTATYDGETMSLYLDGELKTTQKMTGVTLTQDDNVVTAIATNPRSNNSIDSNDGAIFNGKIYDVRLYYNKAFTAEEVNNLYMYLNSKYKNIN